LGSVELALEHADRDQIGKILTLGAGSCRLPYDLHRRHNPELSVAVDINPLLLLLASRVIHGETVPMYEFPVAPIDHKSFAVRRTCSAPLPIGKSRGSFHLLFADALNPPFRNGVFDTVVTPWVIDIIPQDLREFIPTLNRVLKKGGIWVNTGSLAFFHKDPSWCYSEEEVLELIKAAGFEILSSERRKLRYLQSPHSAHRRVENVLTFSARKTKTIGPRHHYEHLPQWILDTDEPIPEHFEFSVASSNHLLSAQVLAAINGKRTIDEIGKLLSKQYGLESNEAENAVRRILVELYEAG
ncbi:MAG: PqqD family peptide modification chaperone, partial [Gammaproteobacteria bacterium]